MSRPLLRLLALLPALGLLGACSSNSKPWACCGQECDSPCWPGPRLGCPEPCLLEPCPPEPWCPEPRKPKCRPVPQPACPPPSPPPACFPPPADTSSPAVEAPLPVVAPAPADAGPPAAEVPKSAG